MESQHRPHYLAIDSQNKIATMLRKFNITSTREYEFFQKLCELKQITIPYTQALKATETTDETFIFDSFVNKFQHLQLMILCTYIRENELVPGYLRLCDEGSLAFFSEYITKQIHLAYTSDDNPLPIYQDFQSYGIDVPKNYLVKLTNEHFLEVYKNLNAEKEQSDDTSLAIYAVDISNKQTFLCTNKTIPLLYKLCIIRINKLLNESTVSSLFTSALQMSLEEIQEQIAQEQLHAWDRIITLLFNNLSEIRKHPGVINHPEIILLIIIFYKSIKPFLMQQKDKERVDSLTSSFTDNLLRTIRTSSQGIHEEQFKTLLQKESSNLQLNEEQTQYATQKFIDSYVLSSDNIVTNIDLKGKNIILHVDHLYIHSNNAIRVVSEHFYPISNQLKEYYIGLLFLYFINKLSPVQTIFFNEEEFEISVRQKVRELDSLYAHILKHPIFLANIIVNSEQYQSNSNMKTLSTTQKLALFFNLRTRKLLMWYEIFNLQLSTLTTQAYQKLSWIRKLILLFTGKYKTIQEKIIRIHNTNYMTPIKGDIPNVKTPTSTTITQKASHTHTKNNASSRKSSRK